MVVAVSATAAQLRLGIWYWHWFIMATHQDTVLDAILADCTSLTDRAIDVYLACKESPFSGTTIAWLLLQWDPRHQVVGGSTYHSSYLARWDVVLVPTGDTMKQGGIQTPSVYQWYWRADHWELPVPRFKCHQQFDLVHIDIMAQRAHKCVCFLRRWKKIDLSPLSLIKFYRCTIVSILLGCSTPTLPKAGSNCRGLRT